jgi:hypothetical protein
MVDQVRKRKQITVECAFCTKSFEKDISEVNRNKKLLRKNYCNYECCGKDNYKHLQTKEGLPKYAPFIKNDSRFTNFTDEFSPFRVYLKSLHNINRKHHVKDIDLNYLYQLWENQFGICPYTGIAMRHKSWKGKSDLINTASIDRIDSTKGYIKGNIQFVCMAINFMKNNMTHEQTVELCKIIAKKWSAA